MAPNTRELILEAAEPLFAEKGFHGVGVREITQRAGVNLAAIHYHFGSKEELYVEMIRRYAEPLNAERMRRIEEVMSQDPRPPVEELVAAFLVPVLEVICPDGEVNLQRLRLAGRIFADSGEAMRTVEERLFPEMRDKILEAFAVYFPDLPPVAVRRRLYFVFGLLFGSMLQWGSLPFLSQGMLTGARFHDLGRDLVRFAAAGFAAPPPEEEGAEK